MATTREDIKRWWMIAKKHKATHLLIVTDTFDYEDYPVEVLPKRDVKKVYAHYQGKNMQKVMEVYNLSMDFEMQLKQKRSLNFDNPMEITGEPFLKK